MANEHYLKFVEQVVTPNRFLHSLGVMKVMGELAEVYQLDKEKAEAVGILHDAAKDLSPTLQKQLIHEGNIKIRFECEQDYVYYLHGPVGAYFVHKELGIVDRLILDAIATHTYCGNSENLNHPLSWCMHFSDILEPTRNWTKWPWLCRGVENLRKIVYAGQIEKGAFLHTGLLIKWFVEQGLAVHPNMKRTYQEFSARLNLDTAFLERQIAASL
jgi:predicted HD superfamily hydrolase involved in NAD metabolism